ncbi:HTTM domain-containing protein [Lewinellaceae bacterium SD302]|nr:HTTM domain-containing protein [Lewinellaceae bacterium SD302]
MITNGSHFLFRAEAIAPLVTFRILYGLLMTYGAVRFMLNGWVEKLYGEPTFFFKFYGFHWVPEPGVTGAYLLYICMAVCGILIAAGLLYRLAVALFFVSFTWAELIDATNYLNHYYLAAILALFLFFIPANGARSLDVLIWPKLRSTTLPAWCRWAIITQLSLVYFFAGLAKLNPDWLFRAMPLAIWLPEHADLPLIGPLLAEPTTAYVFSWAGALYDLTIVCWLLWKPSRPLAYIAVLGFHLMTWLLFNIGLFPLIMITSTLIFFSEEWHERWQLRLGFSPMRPEDSRPIFNKDQVMVKWLLATFFIVQLLLPLRVLAYPGSTFWTEEGYRFGWRVMLVEKTGQATFTVHDPKTGHRAEVINSEFLTKFQEKQMAIQPDFMVQYAHHLARIYGERYDIENPRVTAEVYVALNGRTSQQFIDPEVDLAAQIDDLQHKKWIIPFRP